MRKGIHLVPVTACLMLVLGLALLVPNNAKADLLDFGDPIEGNSWHQRWRVYDVLDGAGGSEGYFDTIELFMIQGDPFEDPPLRAFSRSGWTSNLVNPTYALGTSSSAIDELYFDSYFSGAKSEPLQFDILIWEGQEFREGHTVNWTGSRLTYATYIDPCARDYDRSAVPEPATMLLLGTGLVGLAAGGRKKLKKV